MNSKQTSILRNLWKRHQAGQTLPVVVKTGLGDALAIATLAWLFYAIPPCHVYPAPIAPLS